MGNSQINCSRGKEDQQLATYLDEDQTKIIQETWDLLKDDLPRLGIVVFTRFFQTEQDLKPLFPKIVAINDDNKLDWDIDKDMLQKHAITVMEGLGAAVESLEDSEFLNNVLFSIGQTHIRRHVKPMMLKRLWPSLNHGLKELLKERYTKGVESTWKKLYMYICEQMKKGMKCPDGQ